MKFGSLLNNLLRLHLDCHLNVILLISSYYFVSMIEVLNSKDHISRAFLS